MEEIWKDLVGYKDYYKVSNTGRIWSKIKDREIKPSINNYRYFFKYKPDIIEEVKK